MAAFVKQVNDPVHGTVGLTQIEIDIISSPAFQRLHNVKQLGLGTLVYPGANYSRFAHSIGACHVIGKMLDAISQNTGRQFVEEEWQLYRLGGLLHDVGHFPFSHTLEHVIGNFYKLGMLDEGNNSNDDDLTAYDHETMGRQVIDRDEFLNGVFGAYGFPSEDIKAVLTGEKPEFLTPLISSDLDCDRLDYLMRTAHHAGLPYGDVDVPYIISQFTLDEDGRPCLTHKAIRAADHFLISRYFDYRQVAFHKTVVALELALEAVVKRMLERGKIDCSARAMNERLENGSWASFDDQELTRVMREEFFAVRDDPDEKAYRDYLTAVLFRQPPKMVLVRDVIKERDHEDVFLGQVQQVREKIPQLAAELGVSEDLWQLWYMPLTLTKVGADIPIDAMGDEEVEEESRTQLIWIKGTSSSEPDKAERLISLPSTLVHSLSNMKFFGLRVYVNLCGFEGDKDAKREEICNRIAGELPHL